MGLPTAGLGAGLRDALATADLRRLQLASALACSGGWAFMVGLSVHAYAAGGAAALVLVHRGRVASGLAGGALLAGLALLALALLPNAATGLGLLFVFGVGYALIDFAEVTLVQLLAGDELLARAFSVTETLYWPTTGLGAATAPLLVAWIGTRGALAVAGAGLVILVAVRARRLARLQREPARRALVTAP